MLFSFFIIYYHYYYFMCYHSVDNCSYVVKYWQTCQSLVFMIRQRARERQRDREREREREREKERERDVLSSWIHATKSIGAWAASVAMDQTNFLFYSIRTLYTAELCAYTNCSTSTSHQDVQHVNTLLGRAAHEHPDRMCNTSTSH